ncbi:hypothetical protein U1Q18_016640 [Sarracenia purpurea var. burkii]
MDLRDKPTLERLLASMKLVKNVLSDYLLAKVSRSSDYHHTCNSRTYHSGALLAVVDSLTGNAPNLMDYTLVQLLSWLASQALTSRRHQLVKHNCHLPFFSPLMFYQTF